MHSGKREKKALTQIQKVFDEKKNYYVFLFFNFFPAQKMIFSGWFYDSSARGSRTKRDSYKSDACVTDLTRVRTDLKTRLLWSSPACASALNVYVQLILTHLCATDLDPRVQLISARISTSLTMHAPCNCFQRKLLSKRVCN